MKEKLLKCLSSCPNIDDEAFNEWATFFRQNYCVDDILDLLINGTGMTKQEDLLSQKFPEAKEGIWPRNQFRRFC